jgi:uncharacterized protein (TIGR00251 family)
VIRASGAGVDLDVRVIPRAGRSGIAGERDGRLVIRLAAPPVEGAANDALISFLADIIRCPKASIRIVGGARSRNKRVSIAGVRPDDVRRALGV